MGRRYRNNIAILSVALLLLGGCGELTPPEGRKEQSRSNSSINSSIYTVRAGDTLYSIAWGYGLDHREVAAWNNISPPYTIHPGDHLRMTAPSQRSTVPPATRSVDNSSKKSITPAQKKIIPKTSSAKRSQSKQRQSVTTANVSNREKMQTNSSPVVEKQDPHPTTLTWRWPTEGKVVARFDPDSGKKGVDITGLSGQAIFSAAAGDVVYSGNGLLGYGNLVIIKHDDVFLSAYGHNSQLLVKEGDKVAMGQEIAKMGVTPKEGAKLHFEIRKEGKPVDPSNYLPKKN